MADANLDMSHLYGMQLHLAGEPSWPPGGLTTPGLRLPYLTANGKIPESEVPATGTFGPVRQPAARSRKAAGPDWRDCLWWIYADRIARGGGDHRTARQPAAARDQP